MNFHRHLIFQASILFSRFKVELVSLRSHYTKYKEKKDLIWNVKTECKPGLLNVYFMTTFLKGSWAFSRSDLVLTLKKLFHMPATFQRNYVCQSPHLWRCMLKIYAFIQLIFFSPFSLRQSFFSVCTATILWLSGYDMRKANSEWFHELSLLFLVCLEYLSVMSLEAIASMTSERRVMNHPSNAMSSRAFLDKVMTLIKSVYASWRQSHWNVIASVWYVNSCSLSERSLMRPRSRLCPPAV